MDEIAREAGLSRATLYLHFRNKEAVYGALLEGITKGFIAEVEACVAAPGDAREKLRRIVEIAGRIYAADPILLAAVSDDDTMRIESVANDAMRAHEENVIALLARVLAGGVASGAIREIDPEMVAYLMYKLGNVLVVSEASSTSDFPFTKILDAMDDLINYGLAPNRSDGSHDQ